jgi:hypothetical protein
MRLCYFDLSIHSVTINVVLALCIVEFKASFLESYSQNAVYYAQGFMSFCINLKGVTLFIGNYFPLFAIT